MASPAPTARVVSCNDTSVTIEMVSSRVGEYLVFTGRAEVTEKLDSYEDSGTVEQAGKSPDVHAEAVVYGGGAGGAGTNYQPAIDIEKWSTVDGYPHRTAGVDLGPGR